MAEDALRSAFAAADRALPPIAPDLESTLQAGHRELLRRTMLTVAGGLALLAVLVVGAVVARSALHHRRAPRPARTSPTAPPAKTTTTHGRTATEPTPQPKPAPRPAAPGAPPGVVTRTETAPAPSLPDLVGQQHGSPAHGQVTVRVSNAGKGDAGSFTVRLGDEEKDVDGLGAGESQDVVIDCPRTDQPAVVDARGQVAEADEDNNLAEVSCGPG